MFKFVKNLENISQKSNIVTIALSKIKEGINTFEDHIIVKNKKIINIYDRKCDHQGGKIISKDDRHICPLHNWEFMPLKGIYKNGQTKKKVDYKLENNKIIIKRSIEIPKITKIGKNIKTKIRFFNHAFLQIENKNFKFATDPWAIGPAFNTGWWLKYKTKKDWINKLNSSSFIYISHNHPDHLHPLTLSKVNKDIPIAVPNFSTDSAGTYVESLGFKNIHRLDFAKEYQFKDTNLILSILKSGDFREDSGIYFSIGELTCLFDVDSNMINFYRLPQVDIYASSFAGGASGYPLMFDNYSEKEKNKICKKNKKFLLMIKNEKIKRIKPKYFLPYAGFFEEKMSRDKRIKNSNQKNKIEDYKRICDASTAQILNVEQYDEFYFSKNKLVEKRNNDSQFFQDISPKKYFKYYKSNYQNIDIKYLEQYFIESNFKDNLLLIISLANDDFTISELDFSIDFSIDFSNEKPIFNILSNFDEKKILNINNKKTLFLKCRKESFLNTVYNKAPWEDLLIGFQCRVLRIPNTYNFHFWHHFTNTYITDKHIRFSSSCSKCEKINQYFDRSI